MLFLLKLAYYLLGDQNMKNIIKKYIENLTIEDVKKFIDCHQEYNAG